MANFMPTARNPLQQSATETTSWMPQNQAGLPYADLFNPKNWGSGDVNSQIDAGRHFGGVGLGATLPYLQQQFADIGPGLDMQRQARSHLNELLSPRGQQSQVRQFGADSQRRAYEMGKRIAAQLAARGYGNQDAAAQLATSNQASRDTGAFASDLASPESQGQIAQLVMQLNSPQSIASILPLMLQLDQQDWPRMLQWLQQSAAEKASGGLGGLLRQFGDIAGNLGPQSMVSKAGLGALGGGGADASSSGWQQQVTRRG